MEQASNDKTSQWSDWDAEAHGFDCDSGCGLTVADGRYWLSWQETVALHEWLGEKIRESQGE